MTIRPFEPTDIEPLHRLYNEIVTQIPHHPPVELEQFSRQLLTTLWREWPDYYPNMQRGNYLPEGEIALVAIEAGRPVAFACGSFLPEASEFLPERAGLLRFLFAAPHAQDACRALIRAMVDHSRALNHARFLGLPYSQGPVFHNMGSALLSTAWPWIGDSFLAEGFTPIIDRYSMSRPVTAPPEPYVLTPGSEIIPTGKTGTPEGEFEHSHELLIHGEKAAECQCYFGEKFVRGSGKHVLYIMELFVNEPFRGRGIGKALVRNAIAIAHAARAAAITLRTEFDNFPAISLYRTEGFALVDALVWFHLDC